MTEYEKKIKFLFISVFLSIGVIILILITFMVYSSLRSVHKEVFQEYKKVYINNSNNNVKWVVKYFVHTMENEENGLLERCRQKLKREADIGYNIIRFFYRRFNGTLPESRLQNITVEALKKADNSLTILEKDGTVITSPCFHKGVNISRFKDTLGNNIFGILTKDIEKGKNKSSFFICYQRRTHNLKSALNTYTPHRQIIYAEYFEPYGWYIISSVMYKRIEKKLQNQIINKLNRFRYGPHKKNYVFVLGIDITNKGIKVRRVVNPNLPKKLIGTFVPLNIKDIDGKLFLKDMLRQAFTKGEGFVHYRFKVPGTNKIMEKTTFVKYYPKWHWLVCSGYYPKIFYTDLQSKDAKLNEIIKKNIKRLVIWMLILGTFLFLFMVFFLNNIMKIIKRYRKELVEKERFQKLLIESVPNPLFILDKNGNFININRAFQKFFGCSSKDACKNRENPYIMLVRDKSMEHLKGINSKNPQEFNITDDMGRLMYIEMYNSIVYESNSEVVGVIGVLFDVTKSKITQRELTEISIKDELTDLYNRRYFNQVLSREIKRAKRYKRSLSVIMYDIDLFKKINDEFGHQTGDDVLKKISSIVMNNVRDVDFVFRIGGEEFIILLTDTDSKDAHKVAEKIRTMIENHDFKIGKRITISIGVTQLRENDTFDSIIKRADRALYESKNSGRNRTTLI